MSTIQAKAIAVIVAAALAICVISIILGSLARAAA
jgi:hypothetical protein